MLETEVLHVPHFEALEPAAVLFGAATPVSALCAHARGFFIQLSLSVACVSQLPPPLAPFRNQRNDAAGPVPCDHLRGGTLEWNQGF